MSGTSTWIGSGCSRSQGQTRTTLRHSHASILIKLGVHPKTIQVRLGHTSIRTTMDIYGHLYEGVDEAAAHALDALYQQAAGNREPLT